MSVFDYLDYRKFLSTELERRRQSVPGFTASALARACGMQNTYLTNVLKGRGNFNSDQMFLLAKHLGLNERQSEYFFLLKEYDQSTQGDRKELLAAQLKKKKAESQKTESRLQAQQFDGDPDRIMKYYSDPLHKIIHVILQIPRFAKNVDLVRDELGLDNEKLNQVLALLVELGLIRYSDRTVEVIRKNFHLPKQSAMLLPHQALMRIRSMDQLSKLPVDLRYSFSVTFSADEKTRAFVHEQFLQFLSTIEKKVTEAPSEETYQINFDLFPWTGR